MRPICIAGKNSIAVNAVEYLYSFVKIDKEKILILTNRNDQGLDTWQPSLKKFAQEQGFNIVNLNDLYALEDLLFISLEFGQIIKPELFKTQDLFNIHFSLLPHYKGMYTSAWPLLNGEKYSGVTLHIIDDGIDTGDIVDQIKFEIPLSFTARDLYFKYLETGLEVFKKNIENLISGAFSSSPQTLYGSYYDKKSIDYKNIQINLNKTSFQIYNQIRAFIFPEYQIPLVYGYPVTKVNITNEKREKNFRYFEKNHLFITGIDGFLIVCDTL